MSFGQLGLIWRISLCKDEWKGGDKFLKYFENDFYFLILTGSSKATNGHRVGHGRRQLVVKPFFQTASPGTKQK